MDFFLKTSIDFKAIAKFDEFFHTNQDRNVYLIPGTSQLNSIIFGNIYFPLCT